MSRTAQRWFISIQVDLGDTATPSENQAGEVGVDLGVKHLATLSNGEVIEGPNPLGKALAKRRVLLVKLSRTKQELYVYR